MVVISSGTAHGRRMRIGVLLFLVGAGLVFLRWLGGGRGGGSLEAARSGAEEGSPSESASPSRESPPGHNREEAPNRGARTRPRAVLQVATGAERPVPGAVVTALGSGRRVGATGPTGELLLNEDELDSGEIVITAAGLVPAEVRLPLPLPPRSLVYLEEGAQITGMVLDMQGMPLGAGMTVMAVSPLYYFDDRAIGLTLSGAALIPLVQTDENGTFVLRGLDPARDVRLFCAGKGYASFDERYVVSPGPDAYAEIRASPIYGVFLTFRDASGRQPQCAPMEGRWQGSAAAVSQAEPLFSTRWTEVLLGLEPTCNGSRGYYDKSLFYTVKEDAGDSIPLRYRAELPGYAPVDILVGAGRAVGCLRHQEVILERRCEGFGQVTVVLEPPERGAMLLESMGLGRECKLRLREMSSGKVLDARLRSLAPAGFEVIQGIPYGDYSATFVGPHQLFSHPQNYQSAMNLRVGLDPVTLRIDLPPTETLELEVWRPDGSAYQGPLAGSHLRLDGDQLDAFYFSSGPYRIPLLPTGDYRIVLDNLFPDGSALRARTVFLSGKGEKTRVQWQIPR